MKKLEILDPKDPSIREKTTLVFETIRQLLKNGYKVAVDIDAGPTCPICGGMSIDAGDMFRKQYGKTYRTCIDCMNCFPEEP